MSDSKHEHDNATGEHAMATAWISIVLIVLAVAVGLTFALGMRHAAMDRLGNSAAS